MTATTESQTILSNHRERPGPGLADTRAQFLALQSQCGVYDLGGRAKISVTGGDRVRWLNGMASNNIRDLALGHGVYVFLLNAQGRIQADLNAYNLGDSFVLDVDGRQVDRVLSHFDKFIIMDDVEVKNISHTLTAIGLAGPKSQEILRQAGIEAPALVPLQFCSPTCNCDCGCTQCTLVRGDSPTGTAYEIWLTPDKKKPTWDALVAAGATPVDMHAAELFRISLGVPQFGTDIRERDLPQETGQTRALNFTKGCYLGQEIVERIRSRGAVHRQFTAFKVEGPLPEPGTKIVATEKEVGEVTSSAVLPLPSGDTPVALGYLRREAAEKELLAGSAKLKVAALPIA